MPDVHGFTGDFRCFSNFFPSPIRWPFGPVTFPTVEHGFVWHKTNNPIVRRVVLTIDKPGDVKKFGRGIVLRDEWEDIKLDVMQELVFRKFEQHHLLRKILLNTGDDTLVETNHWHDNFWGDCTCRRCQSIEGENHLGLILMKIREVF